MSSIVDSLLKVAANARDDATLARNTLELLRAEIGADVALFATPRRTPPTTLGMSKVESALEAGWAAYGAEVAPVKRAASRSCVSTDRRALGEALERTRLFREVMSPLGGTESLVILPRFRGRHAGLIMLGRCGGAFDDADLERASALASCLALIGASMDALAPPVASLSLGPTELELLRYLSLGLSNAQIAAARGTSFFTVRNQLSALYRRLGVASRAEAVGVFRGAEGSTQGRSTH